MTTLAEMCVYVYVCTQHKHLTPNHNLRSSIMEYKERLARQGRGPLLP